MLAVTAAPIVFPSISSADHHNNKIKLGLVGCGKRGQWIAELFMKHGGYELVAGADYFQDKLDEVSTKFNVSPAKCYSGLNGYKKLLDSGGVDAVAIISPPFFHPEQAEAAVKSGKQVYLAKPVAVDVPGCFSIEESGALATSKGLTFLVDFQTRANEFYVEAIKRVHNGALGTLSFGEGFYHASDPWLNASEILSPDPQNPENRLRAWGVDRVLSGDIITEQNIHTLDVMSWIMNKPPVKAVGTCNQKIRRIGNSNDHFSVIYDYGENIDVSFTSRQFAAHGTRPEGIKNRMFGESGVLETEYQGQILLRGKKESFYRGGDSSGLYTTGAVKNIADFYNAVVRGEGENTTVPASVRSNLVTLLGRQAAYTRKEVTWQQLLRSKRTLKHNLDLRS